MAVLKGNKNNRNDARIFARMSVMLKNKLLSSAKKSGRSLSGELVVRIAHSLSENEYIERIPDFS